MDADLTPWNIFVKLTISTRVGATRHVCPERDPHLLLMHSWVSPSGRPRTGILTIAGSLLLKQGIVWEGVSCLARSC